MAEISRFFDSTDSDVREYNANEFAEYFSTFYTSGVIKTDNYNDDNNSAMRPRLVSNSVATGGIVAVSPGYALINGYWYHLDVVKQLQVPAETSSYIRYDRIVLRLDKSPDVRSITLQYVRGTSTEPPLTNTGTIVDIPIATLRIAANGTTALSLTDNRTYVKALYSYDLDAQIDRVDSEIQASQTARATLANSYNQAELEMRETLTDINMSAMQMINNYIDAFGDNVWAEIKAMDGPGSGLDADTVDGYQLSAILNFNNHSNKPTIYSLGGNRIYSGTTEPLANLGNNGDIYILVEEE